MRAEAAYCQPIAAASLQGTTEVARENNEGLEWNVREELVPGLCPKQVATGLGPRQVEPQVERSAGGKGSRSRLETRDAPDCSGGGGTGQGEVFLARYSRTVLA